MAYVAITPWAELEEDFLYFFLFTRAVDDSEKRYWKFQWYQCDIYYR